MMGGYIVAKDAYSSPLKLEGEAGAIKIYLLD